LVLFLAPGTDNTRQHKMLCRACLPLDVPVLPIFDE
jgi:hypothetical protein